MEKPIVGSCASSTSMLSSKGQLSAKQATIGIHRLRALTRLTLDWYHSAVCTSSKPTSISVVGQRKQLRGWRKGVSAKCTRISLQSFVRSMLRPPKHKELLMQLSWSA